MWGVRLDQGYLFGDLDADTVSYYYNGAMISTGAYAISGGPLEIQNIDLYSNGGTCYWDDVCFEQAFEEDFDSYPSGTLLDNVGGWFGWDNVPAAAGTADNAFARTGPNSILCGAGADAVHPDIGITCGKWTVTAWQYIPTGGLAGGSVFFILNSVYNHGGPYTWTTQLQCSGTTVDDDVRTSTAQPLVFDQWVKYRADIDLDADTVTYYYNGAMISTGLYGYAGGPLEIQNIDLYSSGGTCYWDDIEIVPTPVAMANVYGAGCAGTGGLIPAIGATGLPVSGSTSFSVDLTQAVANQPATLLFGFADANLPVGGGCTVLVSQPSITVANVLTSATGTGSIPLNIPADVDLGSVAFMQWVVLDPNGAYFNALTLSDALSIQIGK
jgi:hypothetical protein